MTDKEKYKERMYRAFEKAVEKMIFEKSVDIYSDDGNDDHYSCNFHEADKKYQGECIAVACTEICQDNYALDCNFSDDISDIAFDMVCFYKEKAQDGKFSVETYIDKNKIWGDTVMTKSIKWSKE